MSLDWCRLDGKVALVPGTAQGSGQAIAHALAAAGAKWIIADRQAET
jgi:NAD(P)-dependent dehydrogenase (short-subunit alcohol dehydrogenase family)